ncbi:MAG: GTP 3',8-cyclase MoaA [Chloroflexi bacterium]|nr:MAG: GTP 3',8-cyclase MoaA [Chloroflexota bacterium]MBL1194545.1 GTP 3',8-cyclase MoaA [Chloroflexota bacterium]NOH11833.1 GTP 3',8-cyclase MoaA [Chloroflexota bacterium]
MQTLDTFNRPLRDLRISVTDRCNFRCTYCMPKEIFGPDYTYLKKDEVVSFEDIARLARVFVDLGVNKLRLTGGEPLMRRDIENLIDMLANIPGVDDLALTTNGSFSPKRVRSLKDAGLRRMTVSLDALDDPTFKVMNDVDFPVEKVLEWIDASAELDFQPVKVNMVVKRGVNEHSILPMARYFKERGHILRLIEYMDVGNSNGWRLDDVVSAKEMVEHVNTELPLEASDPNYQGEVARRYRYKDGSGELGIIASVTQAFCVDCTRIRLSADGKLYTCLFATKGHDLRALLQDGANDDEMRQAIQTIWTQRNDRYSEIRAENTSEKPKIEMSFIGG